MEGCGNYFLNSIRKWVCTGCMVYSNPEYKSIIYSPHPYAITNNKSIKKSISMNLTIVLEHKVIGMLH